MDKSMRHKEYVKVLLSIDEEGNKKPLAIKINDEIFRVDKVIDIRRAASTKVGGTGIRYTIRILGMERFIFEDENKWFVEAK